VSYLDTEDGPEKGFDLAWEIDELLGSSGINASNAGPKL